MDFKRTLAYAALGLAALLLAFGMISPEQFGAAMDALGIGGTQ